MAEVCQRRGIYGKTVYEYRRRVDLEGAAALEPRYQAAGAFSPTDRLRSGGGPLKEKTTARPFDHRKGAS